MVAKKKSSQTIKTKSKATAKKTSVAKRASDKDQPTTPRSKTSAATSKAKPRAKKTVVKATAAVKKKKTASRKSPEPKVEAPTVVNAVSAAAKRIQEREERRKKKASARLAAKAPTTKKANGTKIGQSKRPVNGKPLTKRDLEKFKDLLLELRDRIVGDIQFLTTDNLHRAGRETGADLSGASQHSADHGTDNFDREFALSLATTEQDVLYEVDEALMRIQEGTYGICEMTGDRIEKARLQVIPYTRFSVQAQTRMEQGRAKYRPFAQAFKGW